MAVIPVGAGPAAGLAVGETAVWAPSDFDGSLARIDVLTNQVSAIIRIGTSPNCGLCLSGVALHEGEVWATSTSARLALVGIDPQTNRVAEQVPLPVFPSAMLSEQDGTLWLASVLDSAVVRIDPTTRLVLARVAVPRPTRLAAGAGAVWATSRADNATTGSVVRIDRLTNQVVANVVVGPQPVAIAFGEGSVWVVDGGGQRLQRVDPRSNTVIASIPVGVLPTAVVTGEGSVWVISHSAPSVNGPALLRIDPSTDAVSGSLALGDGTPVGLAIGAGSLWVASRNPDAVVRVDPFAAQSTESNGSPMLLFLVLLVALLCAMVASRSARASNQSLPVHTGRRLADLQRFIASDRVSDHDRATPMARQLRRKD